MSLAPTPMNSTRAARTLRRLSIVATLSACAPAAYGPSASVPGPQGAFLGKSSPGALTPISRTDAAWVERILSSLTLRQKVAQLIMPWVGGEYAAVGSPEFEQVRHWVQDDEVGGLVLSIGQPLSYGAKLNELQSRAKVPILIASDMENGPGMRLGNIY